MSIAFILYVNCKQWNPIIMNYEGNHNIVCYNGGLLQQEKSCWSGIFAVHSSKAAMKTENMALPKHLGQP